MMDGMTLEELTQAKAALEPTLRSCEEFQDAVWYQAGCVWAPSVLVVLDEHYPAYVLTSLADAYELARERLMDPEWMAAISGYDIEEERL